MSEMTESRERGFSDTSEISLCVIKSNSVSSGQNEKWSRSARGHSRTSRPQLPYCKPANSGLVLGPLNSAGGRLGEKLHVQGSSGPERPIWSIAGFGGATFETSWRLSKPLDFRLE